MNYLVTGGAGFIGTNLVKELLAQGHQVRVIDIDPKNTTVAGVALCDVRDGIVHSMCRGIDVIVHLAAETGIQPSIDNPWQDMRVNVEGTLNILEGARLHGVKRVIFASSGTVLGNEEPPFDEEMATRPTSPYGASKLAGEAYCSAYYHSYGLETVVLRFSNIYGPYAWHKSNLFVEFIRAALNNRYLHIYGDGWQTRDFLYVKDLVDAIIVASEVEGIGGEVFQIASGIETSVRALIHIMNRASDLMGCSPIPLQYEDSRSGEVRRSYADTLKTEKVLNWKAKYALVDGILETFQWYKRNYYDE